MREVAQVTGWEYDPDSTDSLEPGKFVFETVELSSWIDRIKKFGQRIMQFLNEAVEEGRPK